MLTQRQHPCLDIWIKYGENNLWWWATLLIFFIWKMKWIALICIHYQKKKYFPICLFFLLVGFGPQQRATMANEFSWLPQVKEKKKAIRWKANMLHTPAVGGGSAPLMYHWTQHTHTDRWEEAREQERTATLKSTRCKWFPSMPFHTLLPVPTNNIKYIIHSLSYTLYLWGD